MKLHIYPASPHAKKVMIANELLGLNIETNVVNLPEGEHKKAEFLALNPNGKIPVLEYDDGTSLWESNAIINRMSSMTDTDLWPKSNDRYTIMRWQFWEACHFTPACAPYISKYLFKNDSVDLVEAEKTFKFYANVLNGHLESHEFLETGKITTADISVSGILCYRNTCHYPIEEFGHINRWIEQLEKLPAWQKANEK